VYPGYPISAATHGHQKFVAAYPRFSTLDSSYKFKEIRDISRNPFESMWVWRFVERLRENLADFNEKYFQKFREFVPESFRWTGFMSRPGTNALNLCVCPEGLALPEFNLSPQNEETRS
jgi:CRISPR/Cas system-associated endonuclease Cas1